MIRSSEAYVVTSLQVAALKHVLFLMGLLFGSSFVLSAVLF